MKIILPIGDETLAFLRNCLKSQLMEDRGELTALGWLPICPICDEPVVMPAMHEVLLTRRDVQGLKPQHRLRIFLPENCVLVHPGRCHIEAATEEGTKKCVLHLIEHHGKEAIQKWLRWFKGILPNELMDKANYLLAQPDREDNR